jgi:hypothetical protein
MVNTGDLKSPAKACGFESRPGHHVNFKPPSDQQLQLITNTP